MAILRTINEEHVLTNIVYIGLNGDLTFNYTISQY